MQMSVHVVPSGFTTCFKKRRKTRFAIFAIYLPQDLEVILIDCRSREDFRKGREMMAKYVLKRLLISVPVFIGITFLVFLLSNLAPGSPVDLLSAANGMTQEQLDAYRVYLGLDKPLVYRYGTWIMNFFRGDMGTSSAFNQSVSALIFGRLPATLILTLSAQLIAMVIGIPLGMISASRPHSIWDGVSSFISFIGSSIPNFFIALVAIYIFSVNLGILPAFGMYSGTTFTSLSDLLWHLVLPASMIALSLVGNFIKQTKGAVIEVLNEDYIKTAKAKGIGKFRVTMKHVLRNSMTPVVAEISTGIPFLIAGAVTIEKIFSWPGLGSLMITGINNRDYNLITGITAVIAVIVLGCNILLDILYTWLDPRIDFKTMDR